MNILVTGANGFIGRNLCGFLREKGYFVRGAVRNKAPDIFGVDEYVQMGDVNELTDWQQALVGIDIIIHLAACVHIMNNSDSNSFNFFRKVNVLGTERLARMAAKEGVKRFIFISSVKVNGEGFEIASAPEASRNDGRLYTEKNVPTPQDAYGVSKMEAENALAGIAKETGLQVVILRPPLVYGLGVKANFKNLIKIVGSGLPLPFKNVNNRRSFIYLGNLVDAINTCITHPKAAGETFMVSDCADVSTSDLIKMIAYAMGKKTALFSLYPSILKVFCKIMGKDKELEKLTRTLLVDSSKIKNFLGWKPPFTMQEGIKETVKCYK